jgi:signal transduction histidine kinase/CheY-like chemotaxis protein
MGTMSKTDHPDEAATQESLAKLREAEERVADLARFPDENPNPVMRLGRGGELPYRNDAAALLLEHWGGSIPAHIVARVDAALNDAKNFELEEPFGERVFGLGFAPVPSRGYVNVYGRDITREKQAEAELIAARDAALAASRAKSGFLANMSHELRTPMNAIIGYSEMLIEDADDLGVSDMVPDLSKIHSAGRHLLDLINDILDLSKIEAGRMDVYIEDLYCADLVRQVCDTAQPLVEKKNNKLTLAGIDAVGEMRTDATKLRQMLLNLLSNAAKFTENGDVHLRATVHGAMVHFTVSDTGIGMNPEQVAKVFDSFAQADASTTRKYGGSGLGLTITRHYAEMLGGTIDVTSEVGSGTTFTLIVPRESERRSSHPGTSPQPPTRHPSDTASPNTGTVLVIDDDPNILDILQTTLTRVGFDVVCASSGEDGLRLAQQCQPVAITLDIVMQGIDGWNVLTTLKADPKTRDIPVILVTISDDKSLGMALGAAEFITKPIDRPRLIQILDSFRAADPAPEVLIVEDDADLRSLLARTLSKHGWHPLEAADGQQALDVLEERIPRLVLLDLMMPVMDGFQFLARVRADDRYKDIPVVVVTAKELDASDVRRLNGHVAQVLEKGAYSRDELLDEIRKLVRDSVGVREVATA